MFLEIFAIFILFLGFKVENLITIFNSRYMRKLGIKIENQIFYTIFFLNKKRQPWLATTL